MRNPGFPLRSWCKHMAHCLSSARQPPGAGGEWQDTVDRVVKQEEPASHPNPLQAARVLLPGVFSHKKNRLKDTLLDGCVRSSSLLLFQYNSSAIKLPISSFINKPFLTTRSCSPCETCTLTCGKQAEQPMVTSSIPKNHICDFSLLTGELNCQNMGRTEIWLHGSNNLQGGKYTWKLQIRFQSLALEAWGCYIFLLPLQKGRPTALHQLFMLQVESFRKTFSS